MDSYITDIVEDLLIAKHIRLIPIVFINLSVILNDKHWSYTRELSEYRRFTPKWPEGI
jgi:hypothetical protein